MLPLSLCDDAVNAGASPFQRRVVGAERGDVVAPRETQRLWGSAEA